MKKQGWPRCSGRMAVGLWMLVTSMQGWADVLHLSNGDRLTGKVDSISGQHVVLETEFAGRVVVDVAAIVTIETDETFDIKLNDGSELEGKLVRVEEAQAVAIEPAGPPQPLALPDVRSAGQNKLGLVGFGREWSTRADLSAVVSRVEARVASASAIVRICPI